MTTKEWLPSKLERMDEAQLEVLSHTVQQLTHADPPTELESIWKKMQRIQIEGQPIGLRTLVAIWVEILMLNLIFAGTVFLWRSLTDATSIMSKQSN